MPTPDITAFASAMSELFIDAKVLPPQYNQRQPGFARDFATDAQIKAHFFGDNGARDTKNESAEYWTAYVASVYEFGRGLELIRNRLTADTVDNDPNTEFGLMGWTWRDRVSAGIDGSLIAQEVIRDVAAQHNQWAASGVPDPSTKIQQVLALHEVGHQLLGTRPDDHEPGFPDGFIMGAPVGDGQEALVPRMQLRFSPLSIDKIRDKRADGKSP